MTDFICHYKKRITQLIEGIDSNVFSQIVKKIESCAENNSYTYVIGNGGSVATASHIQNDLGSGLKRRGILDLNIVSLCDNLSVITALANDKGHENIFYSQLEGKIDKDDLLIEISCSGNSPNIVKAAEYANNIGESVLGLTGFDGGKLKHLSDLNYHVQTNKNEYGLVEDLHMILDHMLYTYFIEKDKK
jgi:D-sedoheptulose 7-phosphate isomerase